MLDARDTKMLLQAFYGGLPPPPRLAAKCLAGLDTLMGEWRNDIANYVSNGGSLLRIVVAPAGSGKTHLGEALKSEAADKGFLVCQIDAQSQATNTDDLLLYRAFCAGLRLPTQYLNGLVDEAGLFGVLQDVALQLGSESVRAALKPLVLPVPALKDAIVAAIEAIEVGRLAHQGWHTMIQAIAGEKSARYGSLAKLRTAFPLAFRGVKRLPGKRDGRLWMESMLLTLRALGFPGVLLILDEHDERRSAALDQSIVQLRQQLDRLAEGHLPGAFVLYLVLDDFPSRVRDSHAALHQRIAPLLEGANLPTRLMTDLTEVRDLRGVEFLRSVGHRLFALVRGQAPGADVEAEFSTLAKRHNKLHGPDTRSFVQAIAPILEI